MNNTLHLIENLPFASWNKIWFTFLECLLAYIIILLVIQAISHHKKLIYIRLSLLFMLILSVSISWKLHRSLTTKSLTFMSLRKNAAIAFKNGNSMVLISDLQQQEKTFAYSIQPFIDSSKIIKLSVIDVNTDHQQGNFCKKGNLVQFGNSTLLIFDQKLVKKIYPSRLKVNYLYVTGYPKTSLKNLLKNYAFDLLIIDGRNSDFIIRKLKTEADQAGIKHKILKRNNSLTLASNL